MIGVEFDQYSWLVMFVSKHNYTCNPVGKHIKLYCENLARVVEIGARKLLTKRFAL
jgi:hypothetical protein